MLTVIPCMCANNTPTQAYKGRSQPQYVLESSPCEEPIEAIEPGEGEALEPGEGEALAIEPGEGEALALIEEKPAKRV